MSFYQKRGYMEIRYVENRDLKQIVLIEKTCFPIKEAATERQFQQRMQVFQKSFLVATIEGQIVGFINGACIDTQTLNDQHYEDTTLHHNDYPYQSVFGLDVLPQYQHRGIAQKLMNAFIELAYCRGKKGMVLTCKKELISFYQQFGYTCLGKSNSQHGGAIWYDMYLELERKDISLLKMYDFHLSECASLFQKCFQQEPWCESWTYDQSYQRLKEMLHSPYVFGFVLYQDNHLSGLVLGRQMTYLSRKELWIDELCIAPQYQGQSLGTELLNMVKKECQKNHIERIVLNTVRGFLSQHFYKKNAFQEVDNIVCMACEI